MEGKFITGSSIVRIESKNQILRETARFLWIKDINEGLCMYACVHVYVHVRVHVRVHVCVGACV